MSTAILSRKPKIEQYNRIVSGWCQDDDKVIPTTTTTTDTTSNTTLLQQQRPPSPDQLLFLTTDEPEQQQQKVEGLLTIYGCNSAATTVVLDGNNDSGNNNNIDSNFDIVSLLCQYWRCSSSSDCSNNNNNATTTTTSSSYEKMVSFDNKDGHLYSHSVTICVANDDESFRTISNIDHAFLCIPIILGTRSNASSTDATSADATTVGGLNWEQIERIISDFRNKMANINKTASSSIVFVGIVQQQHESQQKTYDENNIKEYSDPFIQLFTSKSFRQSARSICTKHSIQQWYTPILFAQRNNDDDDDGVLTPILPERVLYPSTMTMTAGATTAVTTAQYWKPQYSVDYCFQSMMEQILNDRNAVVVNESTTPAVIDPLTVVTNLTSSSTLDNEEESLINAALAVVNVVTPNSSTMEEEENTISKGKNAASNNSKKRKSSSSDPSNETIAAAGTTTTTTTGSKSNSTKVAKKDAITKVSPPKRKRNSNSFPAAEAYVAAIRQTNAKTKRTKH